MGQNFLQITSDIFQIGGNGFSGSSDAAVYLIKDGKSSALVDTGAGTDTDRILENLQAAGTKPEDIKYLLITHCHFDHTGGIISLKKATGAQVAAHREDAGFIVSGDQDVTGASAYGGSFFPSPVDIVLSGQEENISLDRLSVKMHHTPGHTPGSCVFTVMSDEKLILFGQDVHGPIGGVILRSDRKQYENSLRFLASMNADILCEGHFGIFTGKNEVRRFIESFL